jgi:hypothetical protein
MPTSANIDLNTIWWSTRLYLISALAERLTQVRRIVVARGDEFVGLLSTQWIMSTLAAMHPKLADAGERLQQRRIVLPDADAEMTEVFELWKAAFGGLDARQQEEATKVALTAERAAAVVRRRDAATTCPRLRPRASDGHRPASHPRLSE